ncbi:hypothetical protein C8F01DRAFT_1376773 [Mycena amicta]|nr:hypothetical protein C8F01DRAFT_1376773 [Mycena amicta]
MESLIRPRPPPPPPPPVPLPTLQVYTRTTTLCTGTVVSNLFGQRTGKEFSDLEALVAGQLYIDPGHAIKEITIMHGGVIDGIQVTYWNNGGTTTSTLRHGTSSESTDPHLIRSTVTINADESIIAISGKSGQTRWGERVTQLNFCLYDGKTGRTRIAGPFGGTGGKAFRVTASGDFVAFGGYAINTNLSLDQLKHRGAEGGLYGLTFVDVACGSL